MPVDSLITLETALEDADDVGGQKSVLLGNGFSIDWRPEVFHYASLFEEAHFAGLSVEKGVLFDLLETRDFERAADYLRTAARLAELYGLGGDNGLPFLEADAEVVRNGLAEAVASVHPRASTSLSVAEVASARGFLSHFTDIFTLSYDLLLYWVVNMGDADQIVVPRKDGFEFLTAEREGDLLWKPSPTQGRQRIHFLHGALHLFEDAGGFTRKLRGEDGRLIDQIQANLDDEVYPLIVSEGRSSEKRQTIGRSEYLRTAGARLRELSGVVFVHGLAMSENDAHVLEHLESGECDVGVLYVSMFGDPESEANEDLYVRARRIARTRNRSGGRKLRVEFYDAASAHVWR